jgi:hypothetical protein
MCNVRHTFKVADYFPGMAITMFASKNPTWCMPHLASAVTAACLNTTSALVHARTAVPGSMKSAIAVVNTGVMDHMLFRGLGFKALQDFVKVPAATKWPQASVATVTVEPTSAVAVVCLLNCTPPGVTDFTTVMVPITKNSGAKSGQKHTVYVLPVKWLPILAFPPVLNEENITRVNAATRDNKGFLDMKGSMNNAARNDDVLGFCMELGAPSHHHDSVVTMAFRDVDVHGALGARGIDATTDTFATLKAVFPDIAADVLVSPIAFVRLQLLHGRRQHTAFGNSPISVAARVGAQCVWTHSG